MPKKGKKGKKGKKKAPPVSPADIQALLLLITKGDVKAVENMIQYLPRDEPDLDEEEQKPPMPREPKSQAALVNGETKEGTFKGAPLKRAVTRGYLSIVKMLVQKKAEVYSDHLITAIKLQSYDVCKYILQSRERTKKVLHSYYSLIKSVTPALPTMHHAALMGNRRVMQLLLDKHLPQSANEQIDAKADQLAGRTPLHQASEKGHVDVVMCLLLWQKIRVKKSAEEDNVRWVTECTVKTDTKDATGTTALGLAAEMGQLDVVRALIVEGRLAQLRWNCGAHGDIRAMEAFLDRKETKNRELTPVQWAAYRGDVEMVRFLVSQGSVYDVDDVVTAWFPPAIEYTMDVDLRAIMDSEFSAALRRQISMAVFLGERSWKERQARRDVILRCMRVQRGIESSRYCSYFAMVIAEYDKCYCDEDHVSVKSKEAQEKLAEEREERKKRLAAEALAEQEEEERLEEEKRAKAKKLAAEKKAKEEEEKKRKKRQASAARA